MTITDEMLEEIRNMHRLYYRVGVFNGVVKVVDLQDYDERDYDQDLFVTEKKFESREEAKQWVDEVLRVAARIEELRKAADRR